MKQAFKIWAALSFAVFFLTAVLKWANHPGLVAFVRNDWLFFLLPVFLLGLYIRRKLSLKSDDWIDQFSAGFLLEYLAQKGFPKIHAYNEAERVMWIAAAAFSLYLALLLGWDYLGEKLRKNQLLSKVPTPVYLGLFALACIGTAFWKGWEGRYVMTFLGLTPLARFLITKKNPEVLKAFALFLATDILYADWPPRDNLKIYWVIGIILAQLLLSALVFVFWEKLKEPKALKGRVALLLFAVLPMLPYYYFGSQNWTWVIQVLALGLFWGWNPWLKPHGKLVFFGLASLYLLQELQRDKDFFAIILAVLACAILSSQIRFQYMKLPQQFLKGLFLASIGAAFYGLYDNDNYQVWNHWRWILACNLLLSGLFHLLWEKIQEPRNKKLKAWLAVASIFSSVFALFQGSFVWPFQVATLWLAWGYDSFGLSKSKGRELGFWDKWEDLWSRPFFRKLSASSKSWAKRLGDGTGFVLGQPKVRKAALGILGLALLWMGWTLLYNVCTTHIISFTPRGTVASANTVIRAKFSSDVSVSGGLETAIQLSPALPGVTRLEDSTTLVFTPAAPLKPATTYKVRMSTKGLKSKQLFLQGSATTSFSTEPLKVVSSRLFYTYDLVKETEKELVGELEFNYPVDMNLLRQNLSVFREGAKLQAELEQGTLPTRFFFKAGGFSREKKEQVLKVAIASDLTCVDCGKPLGSKYENTIVLPARPKMLVQEIKLHHVPGNTLISLLFTLPASSAQVRNNVSISPAIPFKVDTEYCYAVLKAEFEPNTDYKIFVRAGLSAVSGEALEKKYEQTLRLEDVQPYVKFSEEGRLIPLDGNKIVGVKTMNLDKYHVNVEKVFRNNIVDFLKNWRSYSNYNRRNYSEDGEGEGDVEVDLGGNSDYESGSTAGLGVPVWSKNMAVEGGELNQEVETTLDFSKWQQASYKGLFVVSLEGADGGGRDSRSFLCTDLGLLMKRSGEDLLLQVLSVSKLTPVSGVKLQMLSNNNQVIQEVSTDTEGRAWFKNLKNNPYHFQPFVVTAQKEDDWSYLRMDQSAMSQSRFDVGGDPYVTTGWDAFLTSDRGLYRPGDKANFTAVVRHANMEIPTDMPVNLTLRDPSGNQVAKLVSSLREFGMLTFQFLIKEDLPTGTMDVELSLENGVHLASTTIKVEEFIPNKIKVEVKPAKKIAVPGEQLSFQVVSRQLFGAPAVNLNVTASVQLAAMEFSPKEWKSYHFSDSTRNFSGDHLRAPGGITDAAGVFSVQLPVPLSVLPPSMMRADVYAEVLDTGGRPVGANASIQVHRYPYYLGLKCLEGKEAAPGTKVHIKYVAITPDGKPTNVKKVLLMVKRKVWYSIFRRSGWAGRGYESSYYEQVVDGKEVDVNEKGSYTFTPDKSGEYTVYLGNEESMRSSMTVAVSGPGEKGAGEESSTNMEDAGKLSLTLNQTLYQVGESPRLEVRAPFAGRLVLSVEREQVFHTMTLPVSAGLNVVSLPAVESVYMPNAYVVGVLVRKPDEASRNLPMVSFGIVPLALNTSSREIDFKWEAPESVKSQKGIDVDLNTGVPGAKVVLAAVDQGILQIISFTTPDPFKYFYRKRGLSTSTMGLFDEILPDLNPKAAVGGDEGESFKARHLNPIAAKRVKSYALFSGILTADKTGRVVYHFATDKFHGEVRVMALGVEQNKFGASAFHVKVADPIVVEPSFPRFLAPGDHFDIPVLLFNNTKAEGKIKVNLSASGPVAVDGEADKLLTLGPEGQKQILFHAKATSHAGKAVFKVTARNENEESFDVETELAVRPGNPLSTEIKFGPLSAGKTQALAVPGGFIPEGQRVRLSVSSSPLLTFLGNLDYLIAYPHGCAEQQTSKAFPLLYFKDMGLLTGRFPDRANAVEMVVQEAIDNVSKQQLSDGTFTLWAGETEGWDYLSNYVSHFLLEAQKQGYKVNPGVMNRILNRLGAIQVKQKGGRLDRRKTNVEVQDSAYILYLKVLAGRADVESMAAMKPKIMGRSTTDRCLLSLAYSALGDRATALSILPSRFLPSTLQRELNGEWFSPNREFGMYLMALTEADPQSKEVPNLIIKFGERMKYGYFGTTQESAWCFMALGRAVKASVAAFPLNAQWSVAGQTPQALTGETAVVKSEKLSGQQVELKNLGDKEIYYHLMAEGTKLESKKESISNGITVSREYRDEKGKEVNLGSVSQGQLVVVTLRVKCAKSLDNLVVVDLLPAGFEVDNPRLSSRGSLEFDPDCTFSPVSQDFRDDRVLLFSRAFDGEQSFSYSVRAVTPGSFQVPGLTAEAMYDPEIFGRSNTGETLVVAPTVK